MNSTNPTNPSNPSNFTNYLTIDVEDFFQVHAFSKLINPTDWDKYESRVEKNTYHILDLLGEAQSIQHLPALGRFKIQNSTSAIQNSKFKIRNYYRATFFILGWIAERYPHLVKEIHSRGHEIASHGYGHKVIYQQSREEFREDVRRSKKILEDLTGQEVIGYRAPTYSITNKTLWALQILWEEGYRYDSSIFPIRHDYYGIPHCPRFPFIWNLDAPTPKILDLRPSCPAAKLPSGPAFSPPSPKQTATDRGAQTTDNDQRSTPSASQLPSRLAVQQPRYIIEFPLSTLNLFGQRLPIAGGGYFRLFPYRFIRWALRRVNNVEKQPFVFYLHPWEIDPDQPRLNHAGIFSKFRHYSNLHKTRYRFARLLQDFSFTSILNGNPYLQN